MESRFDHWLFPTIKNKLKDHVEPYETGSWELFLKKKRKKRRIAFIWSSAAAVLILLLTFKFIFTSYPPQTGTNEKQPIANNTEQNLAIADSITVQKDTSMNRRFTEQRRMEERSVDGNQDITNSEQKITSIGPIASNIPLAQAADIPESPGRLGRGFAGIRMVDDVKTPYIALAPLKKPDLKAKPVSNIGEPRKIALGENSYPEKDRDVNNSLLTLGFSLSSGFGETEETAVTTNGLIREAGVTADIKFSPRLSISSGFYFANQTIESEAQLPTLFLGELSNTEVATTNIANLSVPVNLRYTLPNRKENLFVAAGISSFIRFNADSEREKILEREIMVMREINGMEMLVREVETVTTQSSNDDNSTVFIPAGMVNISAGLANRLSDNLQLEIAPFYKYPLREWPDESARFGIIGMDLRILFRRKDSLKR